MIHVFVLENNVGLHVFYGVEAAQWLKRGHFVQSKIYVQLIAFTPR